MNFDYGSICQRYMSIKWQAAIPLLLVSYYVGHLVSFISSMSIERYARWRYGHPMYFLLDNSGEYPCFFKTGGEGPVWSQILRLFTAVAIWPLWFWEFMLLKSNILRNYVRSMGPELVATVNEALGWLREKAGIKVDPSPNYPAEFESLAINYTLEAAPAHVFSLRNYIVLYGFLRAMTLIVVIVSWLASLHTGWYYWNKEKNALIACGMFFLVGLGCGVICLISYGAFLKFWTRYNREALMGLTAVYLKESSSHSFLE
jgi:hypothetical protein